MAEIKAETTASTKPVPVKPTAAERGEVSAAGTRVAEAYTEVISGPHPSEPERIGTETDGNFEEGERVAQFVPTDGSSVAEPGDPGTEEAAKKAGEK